MIIDTTIKLYKCVRVVCCWHFRTFGDSKLGLGMYGFGMVKYTLLNLTTRNVHDIILNSFELTYLYIIHERNCCDNDRTIQKEYLS